MKNRTLVTQRLYFGVDAFRLREASGRLLARVAGLSPERARVRATEVRRDLGLDTVDGQAAVDEMVAEGLLLPRDAAPNEYQVTDRFIEYANARVVEPLVRSRARKIVASARGLASMINNDWTRNPLRIDAIAPFGCYISQDLYLDKLPIGIVVGVRPASRRARWRMLSRTDGAHEIRMAFKSLSSFVKVLLVTSPDQLPSPHAVVFHADEENA
ncbi:MAG TPA: hypothetical protein VNE58_08140 [Casimicrobiaceae bacterium]|nr:hypothetical protein [Casimicrobiaceae bacterium]